MPCSAKVGKPPNIGATAAPTTCHLAGGITDHTKTKRSKENMKVNFARRQKYNATATEYRGWRFDSKAEANYARELDEKVGSGEVYMWLRQTPFDLGEDTRYRSDFVVILTSGDIFAVDVKGMETQSFKKIKRLWKKYGMIPLQIVKKGSVAEII